jgi:hypothetical protein
MEVIRPAMQASDFEAEQSGKGCASCDRMLGSYGSSCYKPGRENLFSGAIVDLQAP